jgi:tRNA pseudouridine55 synthase
MAFIWRCSFSVIKRSVKKQKNNISGWLNLWKPYGMSSMQAVAKVRRHYNAAKAGHAGTLDPLAEGILPIAFGEATKLIPLLQESAKAYRFTVRWGIQTNTDDTEGETIATSDVRPTKDQIKAALPAFMGLIDQVPPAFSAVKINGERAYALARAGEEVNITARPVQIDALTLIDMPDTDTAIFEVTCGTGTYVRSIARDLAVKLGTVAHCTRIIRVFVGGFTESTAILLENLVESDYTTATASLWPLAKALDDILAVAITDTEAQRLRRGMDVPLISKIDSARLPNVSPDERLIALHDGNVIAICRLENATLYPVRVLNN